MKKLTEKERTIHAQFQQYGRNAREWLRKCQQMLPLIDEYKIWDKRGYSSIYEYAYKLAGMNQDQVRESLRIMRHISNRPALQRVVDAKGLNAVRPVLTLVAHGDSEEFWAEKAMEMSQQTLVTYVREWRKQHDQKEASTGFQVESRIDTTFADSVSAGLTSADATFERVELELPVRIARKLEKFRNNEKFLKILVEAIENFEESDVVGEERDGAADAKMVGRTTEVEGVSDVKTVGSVTEEVASKPDSVRTDSRYIPAAIRRHVEVRARGRCEFSGCGRPYEIFHHTQRWDLEHVHDPDRIVALCKNHERIAHCGLIENEDDLPHEWGVRAHADFSDRRFYVDSLVATHRG